MYLIAVLLIIVIFALCVLYLLLAQHRDKLQLSEKQVLKKCWERLNVLPLYIEVSKGKLDATQVGHVIELRARLMNEHYSVSQQLAQQGELGRLVDRIMSEMDAENCTDSEYLAAKKQLTLATEGVLVAIKQHNELVAQWCNKLRQPWYSILSFGFKKELQQPLVLG